MFTGQTSEGEMLNVVLEPDDMAKVFKGELVLVSPRATDGKLMLFSRVSILATAQPKEVFLAEMRRTGVSLGTTLSDRREKPSPFSVPYEEGVKARMNAEQNPPVFHGVGPAYCPYKSGPWRANWLMGWDAATEQLANAERQKLSPYYLGGRAARVNGALRFDCPLPENDRGRLDWIAGWDAADRDRQQGKTLNDKGEVVEGNTDAG